MAHVPRPAPVMADELYRVLTDLGVEVRGTRGGGRLVAVIDGTEVPIPRPQRKRDVPPHVLTAVARAGGFTSYSEFRGSLLNRPGVKAGKLAGKVEGHVSGVSKADCLAACAALSDRAGAVRSWVRNGSHDPDTYRKVVQAVTVALGELSAWPPEGGTWESPDDTKFRPVQTDSVLNGVARATGLAARAVRRRETMTRWQHDEASQQNKEGVNGSTTG